MTSTKFDYSFWKKKLYDLGYPLSESKIPVQFLRERRAVPLGVNLKEAKLLYQDPLGIDIIFLEFDKLPSRIGASKIARYWKVHQGGRQLIIFSDGIESYTIVIPNAAETPDTKLRILSLSEKIYRTDEEALESMRYLKDSKRLRNQYDLYFLPYEKVRTEFFDNYRSFYADTVKAVEPVLKEHSNSYAQRFLGRLMFLYFLQRKGWLKGNKSFVDTIKDYSELNWVFYEGLSTEGNSGLPYLDGTLFEREEYLGTEEEEMIKVSMDGIFKRARDLFNQYNFTVDELSSREIEVSLDPAMIGTIFENMLPENERGSKGTFYTPMEEISFICRRALASYLKIPELVEKNGGNEILEDGISLLVESLNQEKSEKKVRELREKVLSITVLDPAVGSGGFLLGMMQEMIGLLRQADESVGWNSDVEQFKERILQNMFGFDIEDEAIEIARLRMWLSMIVDKREPEALQSLDLNIVRISDSLIKSAGIQLKLGDELESTWDEMRTIREKFATAKKADVRARLRKDLQKKQSDVEKRTGVRGGIIESWVPKPVDIVVMNPPYVRQESIPSNKKKYYTSIYQIDKKSDLYCYFLLRALSLVKQNEGIVSVISSDKWLETKYGEDLQVILSSRLIGIYGQRERTFDADVNSIIFVYGGETDNYKTTDFVYLNSYSSLLVKNHMQFQRKDLKSGKWFYLRAPKVFMEKIYPKLTHKLRDFAEIRFGIKTGANDFFYMKDVSAYYEKDYLENPKFFEDWGVNARNERDLRGQGLIYIENEGENRFVINRSDTKPLVRTTKELKTYKIKEMGKLCLYTRNPGDMTKKYIEWGQEQSVNIRGRNDPVIGYNNIPSVSGRKNWYSLNDLEPANIILPMYVMDRFFVPRTDKPVICDNTFYTLKSKVKGIESYLNSTLFFVTMELYLRRMGGGVGEIKVDDYKMMPVPDLSKIDLTTINNFFERNVKRYFEEVKMEDRRRLDNELLKLLSIENFSIDEFYKEFVELTDDRIIKANRTLRSQEASNEQDN